MRILVVDNYDSFVFNLVQYLGQLGVEAAVWRNDDARLTGRECPEAIAAEFDGVLLSPGPGTPERAGASIPLVRACAAANTPLLGVCLGHQAIGVAFGATVDRAPELLHGKTSSVFHANVGVLQGLPDPFTATRYHSLTILPESLPAELEAIAHTQSGVIMAVRHTSLPIHGVQFHPESILTEGGHRMLANWLSYCGWARDDTLVRRLENEVLTAIRPHFPNDAGATDRTSA
ncbi:aminodeoxychorismate/anthranilate synthase component II [Mycobacterium gordonae]|uniref:Anthranilate synthase n=1 Tax=Mycobacterium gordonae TaxID=1778 RepID=A0A1A6B9Y4_MYCGO|nr:aminodeoxychorismate/anthranilate synthase component II [Mycobacterium gordonae]MCV7006068.1 aminodeoxychorismate/anthranilate synthase component II [Mycobacterium gordonae]OBR99134.1 anthranilate synthase component II [Mycobacterium gordonae]ODR21813.1 aminodeoxychorismate/anthranilate synthase component II [Mycobacterium gordonae]ORV74080.1 anthranilate synthase [Mycobacterium gordonae]